MEGKTSVLLVNDDPSQYDWLRAGLSEEFNLSQVLSGVECLDQVRQLKPDVILMEVNLSDLDGYKVCSQLKENNDFKSTPVIFLAHLKTAQERMKGFEAGGYDYISKPFEIDDLCVRIKAAAENKFFTDKLITESHDAMQTAMAAMRSSSELGVVMHFMRKSFQCQSFQELSELGLSVLQQYNLEACVLVRAGTEEYYAHSHNQIKPIEKKLIEALRFSGRIFAFNQRTIFNDENVAILILRNPEDQEDYGRLKDHAAFLLEGLNAKVKALETEYQALRQHSAIISITQDAKTSLEQIARDQEVYRDELYHLFSRLQNNLEEAFSFMGLTEDQEQSILGMISGVIDKSYHIFEAQRSTDVFLEHVISSLQIKFQKNKI